MPRTVPANSYDPWFFLYFLYFLGVLYLYFFGLDSGGTSPLFL